MANNNVQNVRFLRNGSLYTTRDAALTGLNGQTLAAEQDGSIILARYGSGNAVKTLVGLVYVNGENKSLTIFDIDGAAADVEKLRQEINAKLGEGVGSGASETVTAQLTALSGNSSSDTSATTSVEGAKKYAKDYTDAEIDKLDYTGVTTGTGVYVTNVTEANGVVSATTATLPSLSEVHEAGKPIIAVAEDKGQLAASAGTINAEFVNVTGDTFTATTVQGALEEIDSEYKAAIENLDYTDTAVTKQFVAAVDESNGVVSITRGEIESSGKTIVLTADGNDVNFEVNIDGVTLEKDANGVISVTSSALVQYEGDGDTIQIGAVSDGKRIVSSPLTISATTPTEANVKEQYNLVGASGNTIGATIKIYKDSSLYSVYLGHVDDTITSPTDPTVVPGTGSEALCFIYHKEDGTYELVAVDVETFLMESEFASGVTADSTTHIVHGVVDSTSESFLTVGEGGFKLSGVQDAINTAVGTAVSGLDASVSAETTSKHVSIKIDEEDGKLTAVTLTDSDIASASALTKEISDRADADTELSNRLGTGVTTANTATAQLAALVGTTADTKDSSSIVGAKKYTDDKVATIIDGLDATISGESADHKVNVKVTEANGVITAVDVVGTDIASASALTAEIAARKAVDGQNGDTYAANTSSPYISNATSLNDADVKLAGALKSLSDETVNQVKVNDVALTETDNAVNVQIRAAAGTGAASTPITVDTDSSTGAITLKLEGLDCGTY